MSDPAIAARVAAAAFFGLVRRTKVTNATTSPEDDGNEDGSAGILVPVG